MVSTLFAAEILQKSVAKKLHINLLPEGECGDIYTAYAEHLGIRGILPIPTDEYWVTWEDKVVFVGSKIGTFCFIERFAPPVYTM